MTDDPRIAAVGSYNHDMSVTVPSLPVPGETASGEDFQEHAGGKGSNQAIAAARSGGDVAFVGAVGDDRFGEFARELWAEEGIGAAVSSVETATGVALIHVDEAGENAIAVASGANDELDAETVQSAGVIDGCDVLLTQLETPISAVTEAVSRGAATGAEVVVDPAPYRDLPDVFLQDVSVLTPNESEVRLLAGHDPDADIDEETAARAVLDRGPDAVVVTLGADGALVVTDDDATAVDPIPVDVVDTTGAGDAFNGAFAVARGNGLSHLAATERGIAAGALACTERGVVPSLPERSAIDELIKRGRSA
ncbi:ribokinase [Natronomonas sp. CBA1123]|uniref:ribokinase n=1 Tax=Natronomonas sp. CBA1123 TaxID=2668070 RepID=UPI0012EAAD43|nr:ribokinase [Natronomonas sp. CBA1123]MUV87918.1 ribokinase [Natronomonas sp. CBA1123]